MVVNGSEKLMRQISKLEMKQRNHEKAGLQQRMQCSFQHQQEHHRHLNHRSILLQQQKQQELVHWKFLGIYCCNRAVVAVSVRGLEEQFCQLQMLHRGRWQMHLTQEHI